ncbi:MAG: S8 family serine peptidase, partial [Thermoanaerobaculia bacterium]
PEFTSSFGPDSVKYAGDIDASNFNGCSSFPAGSFTDSIALISRGSCNFSVKVDNAEAAGAGAVVVFNAVPGAPIVMGALEATTISSCMISNDDGMLVVDFLGFYPDATGQINYPQVRVANDNWQDFVSSFSSRGPNGDPDVLKPEIAAPGQLIFSAWSPLQPPGTDPEYYTLINGTSMASPHVAGAAALVLQQHPLWSPTEIKTALTSTTIREGVVKGDGVTPADPFDRGAGRMDLGNTVNAAVTFDQTSMADSNCFLECSFDRTLVDQGAGPSTWEAFVENASENLIVEVSPSTIMLPGTMPPPAVEPGLFSVYVNTTFVDQGQWHFADIVWKPVLNGAPNGVNGVVLPDASMPLAVFAASSTNEALVTKTADKDVAQPTEVITYDILLTNLGLTDEIFLYDEIPFNSSFIPGSQWALVNGVPDPSFTFEPPNGSPNGAMVWSGMLAPGGIDVVENPSPFGYLPLSAFFAPLPCSSVCDDSSITLTGIPSFDYFGATYNAVVMGSNGIVVIGDDDTDAFTPSNQELPNPVTPNNVIAPFWTDIDMDGTDPGDDGAGIWYAGILGDGTFNYLIMEWEAVEEWDVPGPTYTFQVWIVLETSEIFFVYENFDDFPSFLTVGAEDITGNIGSSYYFDGAGTAPVVGTDLEVVGVLSTASFSFQVETGWEIGEPIVNVVEISSMELGDPAFASAITDVEELDVELYVEGECPGIIDVFGFGATPGGPVRVFRGDWPGTTVPLFRRNCVGTEVELDRGRQFPPAVRADGKGGFHFTRRVLPFQCGDRIQAVDMRSCDVSNTVPLEFNGPVRPEDTTRPEK